MSCEVLLKVLVSRGDEAEWRRLFPRSRAGLNAENAGEARGAKQTRPLLAGARAAVDVRLQFRLGTVMLEVDEHFALDAIRRARRVGA